MTAETIKTGKKIIRLNGLFLVLFLAGCSTLGMESECDIHAQQLEKLAIPPELQIPQN